MSCPPRVQYSTVDLPTTKGDAVHKQKENDSKTSGEGANAGRVLLLGLASLPQGSRAGVPTRGADRQSCCRSRVSGTTFSMEASAPRVSWYASTAIHNKIIVAGVRSAF